MKIDTAELQLLYRAISASNNGITISDMRRPDRPLIFVNSAFTQMTGYSSEESIGRNCHFLQGSETGQSGIQVIRDAVATGGEATVLLRNFKKNRRALLQRTEHFTGAGR